MTAIGEDDSIRPVADGFRFINYCRPVGYTKLAARRQALRTSHPD